MKNSFFNNDIGIENIGLYIPSLRIKREELIKISKDLPKNFEEKAVLNFDEDTLTMGYESLKSLFDNTGNLALLKEKIVSLAFSSTSSFYGDYLLSSLFIKAFGFQDDILIFEHNQSENGAFEGFINLINVLKTEDKEKKTILILSDAQEGEIDEPLGLVSGASSISLLIGKNDPFLIPSGFSSFITHEIGLKRKEAGSFKEKEAGISKYEDESYKNALKQSISRLLENTSTTSEDYKFLLLPQKDKESHIDAALNLGFSKSQVSPATYFNENGRLGVVSSFMGLVYILDKINKNEKIIMSSYAPGSISYSIAFKVNKKPELKNIILKPPLRYIDAIEYLKLKNIRKEGS